MSKIACKFLGARPLKSGELTGMVCFDKDADEHKLIDLRRRETVYLTDEAYTVEAERDTVLEDILDALQAIQERVNIIIGGETNAKE